MINKADAVHLHSGFY